MKPCVHLFPRKAALSWTAMLCLALGLPAALGQTNKPPRLPTPSPVASNAPSGELPAPRSLFVMPTSPKEGRDPFFPRSSRLYTSVVLKTNQVPVTLDLRLNGVSGSPDHRLAIINHRTFEKGEESEVTTSSGRVLIRCMEIKDESVVIRIGGEQRELHLRSGL